PQTPVDPEPYEENGEIIDWHDTKIQMDEDGVRRAMYESTSITVKPYEIKESFSTAAYGLDGKRQLSLRKCAANVIPLSEDIENEIEHPQFSIIANDLLSGDEREIEIDDQVLAHAGESDRVIFFDIRGNDPENPYPDIKKLTIKVFMPPKGGGITPKIGKDYRLFYVGEEFVDMTDCITKAEETKFTIQTDRLGKYVLYANSACYEVTFHYDLPICDENDELLNPDTYIVYHRIENLKENDVVDFPPIPEREGYVFTGWKEWRGSGIHYIQPQPIHASHNTEYYATWCKEEEYEPLKIEISSKKPIRKGKEDGAKIILTISDGYFHADDATFIDWQAMYDAAEDEAEKEEILYNWKGIYHNTWQIVGLDGVEIHAMKYIDSKTMEITLAGNSTDKYKNAEFYVGFLYPTISWELHDENHSVIEVADEKIKIDENGERSLFYYADNTIKVFAQRKSGGGGGSISYTVTFDTDGGSAVEKQKVEKNASAKMPEAPQKEGYIFIGWYKDEAHTEGYDFEAKVTENITLYAAWEEKTIVLTIGETKAMVFGREVQIDAAPMIQNDRTMLPIRFIAESLGAEVLWEEETKTVTVKNTDKVIKIVIGEAKALVGEEEKELDSAAFIENNRTYLPLRFIAENLGAKVTYAEETREVTVAVQ
ncbi:MAG: InlB B-repeat-containing protein, partial [Clostridia bacterium]|nr:InlB B-repeat-containing protein [Clostridia bacterium]